MMNLIDWMPYVTVALAIGVALIAIVFTVIANQARMRAWTELAERTGLQLTGGGMFSRPRLEGSYRGHSTSLYTFTRHTGKSSHTYTVVEVQVNPSTAFELAIFKQSLLSQVGKLMGMKDIEIGDEELDRRFVFRGQPEADIRRLLASGSLRQKLLDSSNLNIRLEGQALKHTQGGVERNVDRLQALFDLMVELAEGIDHHGGASIY
jgi:hypothetical protein